MDLLCEERKHDTDAKILFKRATLCILELFWRTSFRSTQITQQKYDRVNFKVIAS